MCFFFICFYFLFFFYFFLFCCVSFLFFFFFFFFFSSRRRHTRFDCDWSSDVCSSDLERLADTEKLFSAGVTLVVFEKVTVTTLLHHRTSRDDVQTDAPVDQPDRKSVV